jgi:hypothetical protein
MSRPKVGAIYKSYEGDTFIVHGFARHTETNQELVIHQNTRYDVDRTIYARPVLKWFDTIKSTGEKRFTEVKQRKE